MKVLVEDIGPCRKQLRIEVPADVVNAEYEKTVDQFASAATIPGFRPGRAPRQIVERRFQKRILDELRETVIGGAYRDAIRQEKVDAVNILGVDEPRIEKGRPAAFAVTVDVPPRFDLPEYRGIPLKNERAAVTDADVQSTLDHMRASQATYEAVEGRPADDQDLVQVDFEATMDGQPLEQVVPEAKGLGQGKGFWLQLNADAFLAPLAMGFKGASIGESREIPVPFHDKFAVVPLRGRTAQFKATMTGLRRQVLPAVDAAFCEKIGAKDEAELRERIREDLARARAQAEEERRRDAIARHLLDRAPMDLPQSLLEQQTQRNVYNVVRRITARGVADAEIVNQKQQIFEDAQRTAADTLKTRYILHRIADAEKIEVSEAEFMDELHYMAARYNRKVEQVVKDLKEQGVLQNLREDIKSRKTMDFLLREARVEGEVPAEEKP